MGKIKNRSLHACYHNDSGIFYLGLVRGDRYFSYVACRGETLSGTHNLIVTPGRDPIKITLRNHLLEINR